MSTLPKDNNKRIYYILPKIKAKIDINKNNLILKFY